MLTREDCLALCDLDADLVDAIAEHEHIPEIVAAELGCYLCHTPEGELRIRGFVLDDIAAAKAAGDQEKVRRLKLALAAFIRNHPACQTVVAAGPAGR
jgi:cytochrome c551/c552